MTKDELDAAWNELAIKYGGIISRNENGGYGMGFCRALSLDEIEALTADVKALQAVEMKETPEALLARVEALTKPDRHVDAAIDDLVFQGPFEDRLCGCMGDCLPGHPRYVGACVCVPHYTESLEDAAALLRAHIAEKEAKE